MKFVNKCNILDYTGICSQYNLFLIVVAKLYNILDYTGICSQLLPLLFLNNNFFNIEPKPARFRRTNILKVIDNIITRN